MYISGIIIFLLFCAFAWYDHNQKEKIRQFEKEIEEKQRLREIIKDKEEKLKLIEEENKTKNLLIERYMDLAEKIANALSEENKQRFFNKFPMLRCIITLKIEYLSHCEYISILFHKANSNDCNEYSKNSFSRFEKQIRAIILYYAHDFDEKNKDFVDAMDIASDIAYDDSIESDEQMIHTILNRLENKE